MLSSEKDFIHTISRIVERELLTIENGNTIKTSEHEEINLLPLKERKKILSGILLKLPFKTKIDINSAIGFISSYILNEDPEIFESTYYPHYIDHKYKKSAIVYDNIKNAFGGSEKILEIKNIQAAVETFKKSLFQVISGEEHLNGEHRLINEALLHSTDKVDNSRSNVQITFIGTASFISTLIHVYKEIRTKSITFPIKMENIERHMKVLLDKLSGINLSEIFVIKMLFENTLNFYGIRKGLITSFLNKGQNINDILNIFRVASKEMSDRLGIIDLKINIVHSIHEIIENMDSSFQNSEPDYVNSLDFEQNFNKVSDSEKLMKIYVGKRYLQFLEKKFDDYESSFTVHKMEDIVVRDPTKVANFYAILNSGRGQIFSGMNVDQNTLEFFNAQKKSVVDFIDVMLQSMTLIECGPARHFIAMFANLIYSYSDDSDIKKDLLILKQKIAKFTELKEIGTKSNFSKFISVINGSFSEFKFFATKVKPVIDSMAISQQDAIIRYPNVTQLNVRKFLEFIDTFNEDTDIDAFLKIVNREIIKEISLAFTYHIDEYIGKNNDGKFIILNDKIVQQLQTKKYQLVSKGANYGRLFVILNIYLNNRINTGLNRLKSSILHVYGDYISNFHSAFADSMEVESFILNRFKGV